MNTDLPAAAAPLHQHRGEDLHQDLDEYPFEDVRNQGHDLDQGDQVKADNDLDDLYDDEDDVDDVEEDRWGRGSQLYEGSGRAGSVEVLEPGDVVAMLLDRVEAADLLDEQDEADLTQLLGQRPARQLARMLNRELRQAQLRRPRRTLLQGLFGGDQAGPAPALDSVSAVLLRIEAGQRLDRPERARLAGAAGRSGARVLEREIRRASGPRGRWDR